MDRCQRRAGARGGGRPTGVVASFADVSVRRRREGLVNRLGRILEQSRDEVYVFDTRTLGLVQVNRSAVGNTGYTMEELHRLTPLQLLPELDGEAFAAIVEPLRTGDVDRVQFETIHRRRDGSTYPVEMRMQLVGSESPPVIAAVVQDITARHAAELELRGREAENRRLATEQGALRRVATAVAQEDDPQAAFDLVCEEAVRLIGAASGGLVRFEQEGTATRMGAWGVAGAPPAFAQGERLDGDGLAADGASHRPRGRIEVARRDRPAGRDRGAGAGGRPPVGRDRGLGALDPAAMPDAPERLGRFAELVGIAVGNAEARAAPRGPGGDATR